MKRGMLHHAPTPLLALLAMLAVAGLLLPAYGPVLDPGFAEAIPGHGHFTVGAGAATGSGEHADGAVPLPTSDIAVSGMAIALAALALIALPSLLTWMAIWSRPAPAPAYARVPPRPPRSFA